MRLLLLGSYLLEIGANVGRLLGERVIVIRLSIGRYLEE